LEALLKAKSLRFWISLSMMIAITPLVVSAVAGYVLLNHGVIASFQDIADRQRIQINPTQRLRLLIWDALVPVDEFVEEGNQIHQAAYRSLRAQIEAAFARLDEAMKSEPAARTLVQRARDEWTAADRYANGLISVPAQPDDATAAENADRFHGEIAAASDKLAAVYDQLNRDIEDDHDVAILFYERSLWLTGIAGAVSLLMIIFGVLTIGRIIAVSIDRLVDGAARFAEGDRDHRIEVQVPSELRKVAEEFNHMIGRIHDSEAALAELARRDALTGLSNRRAFDDALQGMWARIQRLGEHGALLAIDIDQFKRVNDTHGHAAGDEVLRAVAHNLMNIVRPLDKVFRLGGEEFAVLLPNTNDVSAREVAERLRQSIAANPIQYKSAEISVTVSVGIASTLDTVEQSGFVELADAALYRAKVEGRNRVVSSGKDEITNQDAA
jgi:diguanylate cyclase (GGDEF)-like protein